MNAVFDLLGVTLAVVAAALPVLPAALAVLFFYRRWHKRRGRLAPLQHLAGLTLFMVYLAAALSITLLTNLAFFVRCGGQAGHFLNLVPIQGMVSMARNANANLGYSVFARNVVGNILLFLPLGFFAPLLWRRWAAFWRTFLLGAGASLAVEAIQYAIGGRADIDDLLLNAAGAAAGFALYCLISRAAPNAAACFRLCQAVKEVYS